MKSFLKLAALGCTLFVFAFILSNCKKDDASIPAGTAETIENQPFGEARRQCAVVENHERLLRENPAMAEQRRQIEAFTENYIQNNKGVSERTVVTIPVVFHIVWKTTAQDISQAQIQSQLDVLNADFRRLNANASSTPAGFQGIAADCEVNFCLAQQDPAGNATTGIQRRQTTVTAFGTNDNMKFFSQGGLDAWDATKYLNFWSCNLSGGILGYAQFPGGPANTDGVVCTYTAVGTTGSAAAPFNGGRTATHEVGHWLNLYHIWGDDGTSCSGTDECADTPNQADENYGCPAFPQVSCSNGANGDMFMNYMDYTDDACMNLFSLGQKARMHALFAAGGARVGLLTATGCNAGGGGGSCGIPGSLNATNIAQTTATLNWSAVSGANGYNLQHKAASASTWTTVSNLSGTSHNLSSLTAGTAYQFQVQAICTSTTSAFAASATFTTQSSGGGGGCTDVYETNNTGATSKVIPVNTPITAKIGTATDKDWFKFANTSTQRKIKITLTNLPDDYDVFLYRGSALVGVSENPGTEDEQIILNTNTVSTNYRIKIIGYNGVFSNTACYSLKAEIGATNFRLDDGGGTVVRSLTKPQTKVELVD